MDADDRHRNAFARAVIRRVDDGRGVQRVQVELLKGEFATVERPQNYGHSTVPLPGTEAFVAFVGGNRDHGIIVAMDDRGKRPRNLQAGEQMLYSVLADQYVHLRADGSTVIKGPEKIRLEVGSSYIEITDGRIVIRADDIDLVTG